MVQKKHWFIFEILSDKTIHTAPYSWVNLKKKKLKSGKTIVDGATCSWPNDVDENTLLQMVAAETKHQNSWPRVNVKILAEAKSEKELFVKEKMARNKTNNIDATYEKDMETANQVKSTRHKRKPKKLDDYESGAGYSEANESHHDLDSDELSQDEQTEEEDEIFSPKSIFRDQQNDELNEQTPEINESEVKVKSTVTSIVDKYLQETTLHNGQNVTYVQEKKQPIEQKTLSEPLPKDNTPNDVNFKETMKYHVIPSGWIDEATMSSLYPASSSKKDIKKFVKESTSPGDDWESWEIVDIKAVTGDYLTACVVRRSAELDAEEEDEDEEEEEKEEKKKDDEEKEEKKKEDEEEEESDKLEKEAFPSFSKRAPKRNAGQDVQDKDENEKTEKTMVPPSKRMKTTNNVTMNKTSIIQMKKTSYNLTKAEVENMDEKDLFVIIYHQNQEIIKGNNKIIVLLESQKFCTTSGMSANARRPARTIFPLNSCELLVKLDDQLRDEANREKAGQVLAEDSLYVRTYNFLADQGGSDGHVCVVNMLKSTLSDEVQVKFTFKGNPKTKPGEIVPEEKACFDDLQLWEMMREIAVDRHRAKNYTSFEADQSCMQWIKSAGTRIKRKSTGQKKPEKNETLRKIAKQEASKSKSNSQ